MDGTDLKGEFHGLTIHDSRLQEYRKVRKDFAKNAKKLTAYCKLPTTLRVTLRSFAPSAVNPLQLFPIFNP
jgi:hypothetical protein